MGNSSIKKLISTLIERLDETYSNAIINNQDLILEVVEQNPRQTKRFINNFILASSAKSLNARVYFLRELLVKKWPDFYKSLSSDQIFREKIKKYANMTIQEREKHLEEEKQRYQDNIPENYKKALLDKILWGFLDKNENKEYFLQIFEQWHTLESIAESLKSPLEVEWQPSTKKLQDPDLTIYISEKDRSRHEYEVFMSSPKNPLKSVGTFRYSYDPKSQFEAVFKDFERSDLPPNLIDREIANKGMELYAQVFPNELKNIYWQIREDIKSIRVISQEPWTPWEIIKPWREIRGREVEEDGFLCERYALSRWIEGQEERLKEQVRTVTVIIPSDIDLSSALKEREWIREFAETKGLDFYVNSTYQDVIKTLETGGIDLLHFSTHSRFHEVPDLSSIVLENGIEFRPQEIIGKTTKFGQTNPMVIMNTGQGAIQAWADKFIRTGASACIGPMWNINDETAFRFTKELYTQLSTDRVSVGEAVRRARNYCRQSGDLSWLSYVLFGHPNSTIKIGS